MREREYWISYMKNDEEYSDIILNLTLFFRDLFEEDKEVKILNIGWICRG